MKTESETLFEKLCSEKRIPFEPIPTEENLRTPDYRIWLNTTEIIVEVKQMELNKDDLKFIENVAKGIDVPNGFRGTGHIRIRNIIDDAYPQLKNFAKDLHPSIVVACDLTKGLSHLDNEDILNAMYGDEIVIISDTSKDSEEVSAANHKFGGNRKVTKRTKRSLSAVALLDFNESDEAVRMTVFHNIHAKIPLDPRGAWKIADQQFTLQYGSEFYQYWLEITQHE
ncbi:MAG: hypothetical protein H6634_18765 [Anaerolineales bacterium]|nr:hypothetical protein [Anaerolineales bacterium]